MQKGIDSYSAKFEKIFHKTSNNFLCLQFKNPLYNSFFNNFCFSVQKDGCSLTTNSSAYLIPPKAIVNFLTTKNITIPKNQSITSNEGSMYTLVCNNIQDIKKFFAAIKDDAMVPSEDIETIDNKIDELLLSSPEQTTEKKQEKKI